MHRAICVSDAVPMCLGCRASHVSDAVTSVSDAVPMCLGCRARVSRMPCLDKMLKD